MRRFALGLVFAAVCSCGGAQRSAEPSSSPAPAEPVQSVSPSPSPAPSQTASPAPASRDSNTLDVRGDPNVFDVSGNSDLPDPVPSTAQPFVRIAAATIAPYRAALDACTDPMGSRAPRYYRVTIETDGTVLPLPPQPVSLPASVAECLAGVVRSIAIASPPPVTFPYHIPIGHTP